MSVEHGKRWWHVGFISGWIDGVSRLFIIGGRQIGQDRYHAEDNPLGWREDQFATCGWVDDRLELLAQIIREQTAEIVRLRRAVEIQAHAEARRERDTALSSAIPRPDEDTSFVTWGSGGGRNDGGLT